MCVIKDSTSSGLALFLCLSAGQPSITSLLREGEREREREGENKGEPNIIDTDRDRET